MEKKLKIETDMTPLPAKRREVFCDHALEISLKYIWEYFLQIVSCHCLNRFTFARYITSLPWSGDFIADFHFSQRPTFWAFKGGSHPLPPIPTLLKLSFTK